MRIAVVGGGPGGLYFATLWKLRRKSDEVHVYEQNPPDATWGFGVVLSEQALDFLREDDPETVAFISPHLATWREITVVHRGQRVPIDGIGFSAIGRLELIQLLQQRAKQAGAILHHGRAVQSVDELGSPDLIVGADGLNSVVRRAAEAEFGPTLTHFTNKFAWYGTDKVFDTLTQTFVATEFGAFNAHHYRYGPNISTFVVECDAPTWERAGFATMSQDETTALCERVFADALGGHRLISNKSLWRNFPKLWCRNWGVGNMVLLGDALHTSHFSIGSGTRLALEDAVALVRAIEMQPTLAAAFAAYHAARAPVLEKLVHAANSSGAWYENFAQHMKLDPLDFALSYITRSGRIAPDRLRRLSPGFMAAYEARRGPLMG